MNSFEIIFPLAFLQNLGGWEIFAIVAVILLLFGGKKLPELARGAGKAIREFKKISSETEETFKRAMDEDEDEPKKKAAQPRQTPPPAAGEFDTPKSAEDAVPPILPESLREDSENDRDRS